MSDGQRMRPAWGLGLLIVALGLVVLVSPWFGAERIDAWQGWRELRSGIDGRDGRILALRLPRIVLSILAGGALALSGAAFQTLLRNALATPYTLGVSFAGALGAFLALSIPALHFSLGPLSSVSILAFAFAAIDVFLLYGLARRRVRLDTHELLLAGVTLNFFFGAVILLVRYLTDPLRLRAMDHWMMGSLSVGGWSELVPIPLLLLPGLWVLLRSAPALDQLGFGEELATARGVNVGSVQRNTLFAASLVTASVVAVCGPIGFVGLIAPHATRRILGAGHRWLLPGSFVLGAAFLTLADLLARSLPVAGRGTELPVGVLTALGGTPLFLLLLIRSRRG